MHRLFASLIIMPLLGLGLGIGKQHYKLPMTPQIPRKNLFAWFNSDIGVTTTGGVVTSWSDSLGNANTSIVVGSPVLVPNAFPVQSHNRSAIQFNGASAIYGAFTGRTLPESRAIVLVYKFDALTSTPSCVYSQENGIGTMYATTPSNLYYKDPGKVLPAGPITGIPITTSYFVEAISISERPVIANFGTLTANYISTEDFASEAPATSNYFIGCGTSTTNVLQNFATCKIVDVLVYNNYLTGPELNSIRSYYGINS